jgi:hypothetical protein
MSVIPLEYVAFPCAGVISAAVVFYLWCCFLTAISNFDIQDPEHLRHPLRDRTITLPRNTSLSDLSLNDLRPPSPLSSDEDEGVLQRNNSETSLAATVKTAISSTSVHHVLELGNFPEEAAKLSVEDRYKFVRCCCLRMRLCALLCLVITSNDCSSSASAVSLTLHRAS